MKKHSIRKTLSTWKHTLNYLYPIGPKFYLVGTPVHENVGDSAIVVASLKFLRECCPKANRVKEMTHSEYRKYNHLIHHPFGVGSHVFGQGGGNMGNLWFGEEIFRRNYLTSVMAYHPLILPQTIFYTDSEQGRQEQERSIPTYNHPEITIVAREQTSFDWMRKLYPQANVLLTPDIVLSTTAKDYGVKPQTRSGILWVMRSDKEKCMTPDFENALLKCAKSHQKPIYITDMYTEQAVTKQNRLKIVQKKMLEFAASELVITDRLHGMIFAAITETPCIVFSNNHHKVRGTYEWLRHLPYICLAESIEDAEQCISKLLKMKNCHFDNTPLLPYFDTLKQEIRKETK